MEKDVVPLKKKEYDSFFRSRIDKVAFLTGQSKSDVQRVIQAYIDSCVEEAFIKTENLSPYEWKELRVGIPGIGDIFIERGRDSTKNHPRFSFYFKPYFDFRKRIVDTIKTDKGTFDYEFSKDLSVLEGDKKEIVSDEKFSKYTKRSNDSWSW